MVLMMNRGVADSLSHKDIEEIVQKFLSEEIDLSEEINLSIIAEVICTAAFEKIVNFSVDRPLVRRLRNSMIDPSQVAVDEPLIGIDFYSAKE